jgi:hypothetical protein
MELYEREKNDNFNGFDKLTTARPKADRQSLIMQGTLIDIPVTFVKSVARFLCRGRICRLVQRQHTPVVVTNAHLGQVLRKAKNATAIKKRYWWGALQSRITNYICFCGQRRRLVY